MLNRTWISGHIPHQGQMCLLDEVVTWSPQKIVCKAISHHRHDNPLRADGQLSICAGIEYAAQTMAVHGALLAPLETTVEQAVKNTPKQGYLTSVRSVQLHATRLDNWPQALVIQADRLNGDEHLILYQFSVQHDGVCLIHGRASVVMDAQRVPT